MALPSYIVTSSAPVSDVADADVLAGTGGAATIGIADAGSKFTGTTVEAALQECVTSIADNTWSGINVFNNQLSITGTAHFGSTTNYVQVNNEGNISLVNGATQYDDLVFEMTPSRRNPATTVPDWDNTRIGFLFPQNDPTEIINIAVQMPHSWKQGSDIYPHVHVQQEANQQAVFKLDYDWVNIGASITGTAWTTYSMTSYVTSYVAGATHNILHNSSPISGSGKTMSSLFKCKLYRDDNVYTGDMLASQFDIHIEKDSFGSNTEYTK